MNQFVLLDHSIKRIGGHNYEYALHVLTAAERQGYRPILAVNHRFFERGRLPSSWQLHAPFHHTTYETGHLTAKQRRLDPDGAYAPIHKDESVGTDQSLRRRGWWLHLSKSLKRRLAQKYERQKQRIVEQYAADLTALFGNIPLDSGDHIFVPTLSQEDLAGLLEFARSHTAIADLATWHLQFHFSLYEGRPSGSNGYEGRWKTLRKLLSDVSRAMPQDHVRFYTTTDILADQYNQLGGARFRALPYPVNPALLDKSANGGVSAQTLRVTCAGGVRPEKGTSDLYRAVAPLWHDYVDTGRIQLVVQAKRLGKLPRELRRHVHQGSGWSLLQKDRNGHPKVEFIRWPLSTERYLDLIRDAHIGLLLYDPDQYYARCSGVMVEMLKAGVPVIVPAGCWMADQIAEPIFAHRDSMCQTTPIAARLTPADADWEAGRAQRYCLWRRDSHLLMGGQAEPLRTRLTVPAAASHLCVRFRWETSTPRGSYLQLSAATKSLRGSAPKAMREIVGIRRATAPASILFSLASPTNDLQLTWQNAFSSQLIELKDVEFLFLSAVGMECPLGAVGRIAAGVDQAPDLLRDIVDHYAHYRRTAEAFAPDWGVWHSPAKVVQILTRQSLADARFAA